MKEEVCKLRVNKRDRLQAKKTERAGERERVYETKSQLCNPVFGKV